MIMVELSKQLVGFLETLRETHKTFVRNGRLMASVAAFTALVSSILLLTDFFLRQFIVNRLVKQIPFLAMGLILAYPAASVTILTSALSQSGQGELTCPREMAVAVARCWKRPLATYFYVYYAICCGFVLSYLLPLMPSRPLPILITCGISTVMFYAYIAVLWAMAVVVSVLEEKLGMESLGKGSQLVKGMELKGFCLTLVMNMLSYGAIEIWRLAIGNNRSYYVPSLFGFLATRNDGGATYGQLVMGLVLVNGLCLVRMYGLIAFTVLYCKSKRNHGEEAEIMVLGLHYTNVSSLPTIPTTLP